MQAAQLRQFADMDQACIGDRRGVEIQVAQVRQLGQQLQTGVAEVAVSEIDRDHRPAGELVIPCERRLAFLQSGQHARIVRSLRAAGHHRNDKGDAAAHGVSLR